LSKVTAQADKPELKELYHCQKHKSRAKYWHGTIPCQAMKKSDIVQTHPFSRARENRTSNDSQFTQRSSWKGESWISQVIRVSRAHEKEQHKWILGSSSRTQEIHLISLLVYKNKGVAKNWAKTG
jgi:hypothetical protein